MTAKYYVWAGGRWCEVCPATGRVSGAGWKGRANFVFVRRGRLHVARQKHVLRGLRALSANQPTSVHDGAKLRRQRRKRSKHTVCSGCHHGCCAARKQSVIEESVKDNDRKMVVDAGVQATLRAAEPQPSASARPAAAADDSCSDTSDSVESHKELVVDEDDVDVYRSYLIKHDPNFDLLRFDSDENFRSKVFFKINPLVAVERCPRIGRMLRGSQCSQDTISLKDFATKLGLRSISDHELENNKRYKMRRRKKETSEAEDTDKENHVEPSNRNKPSESLSKPTNKNLKKKLVEAVRRNISNDLKRDVEAPKKPLNAPKTQKQVTGTQEPVKMISDSDQEFAKKSMKFFKDKIPTVKMYPLNFKKNKVSTVHNGYSSLEDHAIVAWVSGGRSRLVNGNKVWRELQAQFPAITGVERTFHSLRNRYLRYILPSLQRLALPPHQASRLRADAAAGSIKLRNKKSDPYPFSYPHVKSAWAARQKSPSGSAQDESDSPDSNDNQKKTSPLKTNKEKSGPTKIMANAASSSSPPAKPNNKRKLSLKPSNSNEKSVTEKKKKSPEHESRNRSRSQKQNPPSASRGRISLRDKSVISSSSESSGSTSDSTRASTESSDSLFQNKSLPAKRMQSNSTPNKSMHNKLRSATSAPRNKSRNQSSSRSLRENLPQSQSLLPRGKTPKEVKSRTASESPSRNTLRSKRKSLSNANKSLPNHSRSKNSATPSKRKRVRSPSASPIRAAKKSVRGTVSVSDSSSEKSESEAPDRTLRNKARTKSRTPPRINRMSREVRLLTGHAPRHKARPRTRRLYNHTAGPAR